MIEIKCPNCKEPIPIELFTSALGRIGGSKTSEAKKRSSRANGRLGGRPPKHKGKKR